MAISNGQRPCCVADFSRYSEIRSAMSSEKANGPDAVTINGKPDGAAADLGDLSESRDLCDICSAEGSLDALL